jgi:hypothetical protein
MSYSLRRGLELQIGIVEKLKLKTTSRVPSCVAVGIPADTEIESEIEI